MLDWLTATVPYSGPDICGGRILVLDDTGEIKFEKLEFKKVIGSFEEAVRVRSVPNGLLISGNPAKFLQGHNLFGIREFYPLMCRFVYEVLERICALSDENLGVVNGDFTLSRVDMTESYQLGCRSDCLRWIEAAGRYATGRVQRFEKKKTTVNLGRYSRRKTLTIYYKADEIEVHPPAVFADPVIRDLLRDWAKDKIRVEWKLRGMKLSDMGLKRARDWEGVDYMKIYNNEMAGIKLPGNYVLSGAQYEKMPRKYRLIYDSWQRGIDIENMVSRMSWYRYRKYFFDTWGINIAAPSPNAKTVVVPLMEILRAKPAEIPDWAYDFELVAA